MSSALFETVGIVGLGLIGASLAHAIRHYGGGGRVIGYDASPDVCARVRELALVDHLAATLTEIASAADLLIICTPVGSFAEIGAQVGPALRAGAILSDVGSVKAATLTHLGAHLAPDVHLIPAHPVAGTEHSGPDAGFATLFDQRWCIFTPPPGTDPAALEKLTRFWQQFGAKVELMDADHHDLVLAITSHLPHLIAYTIVGTASDLEQVTQSEVIKFSAGGFRDFTRIAASDPVMWRDIFLNNREAVLTMLQRFSEDLTTLQRAIRWGDGDTLQTLFTHTRAIRREVIDARQDTEDANFGRPSPSV